MPIRFKHVVELPILKNAKSGYYNSPEILSIFLLFPTSLQKLGTYSTLDRVPSAKEYINNGGFKKDVPLLDEVVVMEVVAHFLNQEKPDEINKHIREFIKKF
ncbi:hypothetical protein CsSME_00021204 [Camellia sinensis var. sinensis]